MKKIRVIALLLIALLLLTACGQKEPGEKTAVALPDLSILIDGENVTPAFFMEADYMNSLFTTLWLMDTGLIDDSEEFYNCAVCSSLAYSEAEDTFALAVVTKKTNSLYTWKVGEAEGYVQPCGFSSLNAAESYLKEHFSEPIRNSQDGVNFSLSYLTSTIEQGLEGTEAVAE